jgi:two-component system CheB/CheR fusion protein
MPNERVEESYLVVIGASAGGIEALEHFAAALPADFPAPIVVAQHANPRVPSRLGEILGRRTAVAVVTLDGKEAMLEPATIYLAPSGKNIAVNGPNVVGSARLDGHPIPSIDALFTSAAESYGDRVVAVILTGMGTDGVAGVRTVKERGGTVLVQEPESAAFPALPAAIPRNYIDYTVNLEALPALLATLVSSPQDGEISNPDVLRAFLNQLRSRTGIDFRQYKTPTIVRRLSRLMVAAGRDSLTDYMAHLAAHPEAYQRLISAFLIKVTEFFRDPALFSHLRETVLPEIIEYARKNRAELRLWSAGCATGEEAYSLAIALADLLGDEVETLPVRIFATDLDRDAIAFARRGIYPASALKEIPADLLAKYFTRVDGAFQIKRRIRNLTFFGEYDLGQRAPFPRIDLVLCRNVLIYFTKELQQRTLSLFAFSLRAGGYLVLGKSETTSPLPQYFEPVQPSLKIFRRYGERLLIPAPATVAAAATGAQVARRHIALGPAMATRRRTPESAEPRWSLVDRLGAFLFESPIGVVVVDRNYDISTINQAARSMLGIHGQGIGEDLVHLSDVPSGDLKAALDAAFRNELPGDGREIEVRNLATNEARFLQISCFPDRTISKGSRIEGVFVLVEDLTATATTMRRIQSENDESKAIVARLAAQNGELLERQRTLGEANEELTVANADLRNANEHLLISAEEAEASAEEVETLNEEMQATSEELETLNEELQATVEELNTTNEELTARSSEVERISIDREEQLRAAQQTLAIFAAAIERVPLIACVVDEESKVAVASQQYVRLAERNASSLPAAGALWRQPAGGITLTGEDAVARAYAVRLTPFFQAGGSMLVQLSPASESGELR